MNGYESEAVKNIRPHAHGCNVMLYPDERLLLCWYVGIHEGSEDMKIAVAIQDPSGVWGPTDILVGNFEYAGDRWVPEIGVPMLNPKGETMLYFWACPISSFYLQNTIGVRWMVQPNKFINFPFGTFRLERDGIASQWLRSFDEAVIFRAVVKDGKAQNIERIINEKGLLLYGPSLRLRSGRWMLPLHTHREREGSRSRFLISDVNQENWKIHGDIFSPPGCTEPTLVQLRSGEILCYMRYAEKGIGHIWRSISTDEGRTFSRPELTNLRNPNAGVHLTMSASGRLLLAYNDSYYFRTPLCVGVSDDRGKTWYVRDIEIEAGEYSYPKLIQTSDGLWHIFYTHNRTHIQHGWFKEEWLEGGRKVFGLRTQPDSS